jgi:polar amino acid transport system substrate-binding protein
VLTRRFLVEIGGMAVPGAAAKAETTACAPKVSPEHLLEPGKWQMLINPTLPPQQFIDEKGELQGLNVELAQAMAAQMCLEPVFLRRDFPPMIPGLRAAGCTACSAPTSPSRFATKTWLRRRPMR